MAERAWTLRSISGCQISSVNIDCSRGKNAKFISTTIYWGLPMCRAWSQVPGMEGWISRMSQHDCCPQMAEGQLGETTGQQTISVKCHHCSINTQLDLPSERSRSLRCPRDQSGESLFWEPLGLLRQHRTHRGVWESIVPGGVCSVIYHFCRLS